MFLLRPDPELDESLESYLLRLSEQNHFRVRKLFPHFGKLLQKQMGKLAGAMPSDLAHFNLYHAGTSSSKRYWSLHLLSDLCCKQRLPLLELAVLKVNRWFGEHHTTLFWKGTEIPQLFFRSRGIPVCPQCLRDKAYIPVYWHMAPMRACPRHGCSLLFKCPQCSLEVDYIRDENICVCQCGYELVKAETECANTLVTALASRILGTTPETVNTSNLLFREATVETVFGAVLWYMQWVEKCTLKSLQSDEELLRCIRFFDDWPSQLFSRLDELAEAGLQYSERSMKETPFRSIFGSLLRVSRYLPDSHLGVNDVLKAVFSYLDLIIFQQHHKFSEISQTLLDSVETCTILGTGIKQLGRVIEEGLLHPCHPQKEKTSIRPEQPLFRLRDVFLLWSVRFQKKHSNRSLYLSRW